MSDIRTVSGASRALLSRSIRGLGRLAPSRVQGLINRLLPRQSVGPDEDSGHLRLQIAELKQSRKRIVVAHDAERRRLERDIHDGAQQQLVSMAVKLGLAKQALAHNPGKAGEVLDDLREDTGRALECLRELARALFPPLLEDKGLGCAVQAQIDRMGFDASLGDELEGARFDPEVESSAFFVIRQALQGARDDSLGRQVSVRLWTEGESLRFSVTGVDGQSQGHGSPKGWGEVNERVEALGGELLIHSAPGAPAATLSGRLPSSVQGAVDD